MTQIEHAMSTTYIVFFFSARCLQTLAAEQNCDNVNQIGKIKQVTSEQTKIYNWNEFMNYWLAQLTLDFEFHNDTFT